MGKNKDFEFNFYWDDEEEQGIEQPANEAKKPKFQDIVSDSKIQHALHINQYIAFDSDEEIHDYRKKKHGIAGFFQKIGDWWRGCRRWQRVTLVSVVCVTLLVSSFLIWFFSNFSYRYRGITTNPDDLGFEEVIDKEVTNIALFGIDTRDINSFNGLADSIMILSLNSRAKTVKLVSVLRDTLVRIEKNGKVTYNKINSSYSGSGGPELAIKTLNQNFGLDISEYATVNFYGMADIINAVGGIDVELTDREVKARGYDNHGINDMILEICEHMKLDPNDYYVRVSGKQHLNGVQAVAYSRIRYIPNVWGTTDDYGRTDRQRYVMEQLFNKALTLEKSQYISLAKSLIPCTETSLSYSEIISLAFGILLHSPHFEQERLPQVEYQMPAPSISGVGSCVYYDLEFAAVLINNFFYKDISFADYVAANGIQKNDWYAKRVGSSGTTRPSTSNPSSSTPPSSTPPSSTPPSSTPPSSTPPSSTPSGNGGTTSSDPSTGNDNTSTEPGNGTESPGSGNESPGNGGDGNGDDDPDESGNGGSSGPDKPQPSEPESPSDDDPTE